jgi:AcrR family transcriptional regulator
MPDLQVARWGIHRAFLFFGEEGQDVVTRMTVTERRGKLVDAAIAVMARDGVHNATTRSIVAEAGMQIGVFHYCFRSKDELLHQVMRTVSERSFSAVGSVLGSTTDPVELIRLAVRAYWERVIAEPEQRQLTYELTQYALRHSSDRATAATQYAGYVKNMRNLLQALASAGGFTWRRPVEVEARMVLAMTQGITFQWLVDRDDVMAAELLDELAEHLVWQADLAPTLRDPVEGGAVRP